MTKDVRRLYRQFHPENYALSLAPDREAMMFSGTVVITGKKVGRPSQRITLHQNSLKIVKATIVRHGKTGDQKIAVGRINTQDSFDEVRLHAKEMLFPGDYTVTLEFRGLITRPMNGIYPCYFKDDTGKEKMLIATQFESHHAREAFPCIDEPEAKATFELTLTTPKGETVISNTAAATTKINSDSQLTTFQTTPKMSTYLLAFVYGDLAYQEATTKTGVQVRSYATPANSKFLDFSLNVAVKCLDFYNDYFGLPYPLEKCDMIALPDFASGAMENWGCITYREQCLLVDPANTSLAIKQYVAMVVAHELAHQWFGNLVTMRWWTDLWLNEGFASWIEYLAVDHLFPEWQMWTQFLTDEQQSALRIDALENTHPIEVAVHHPDEIRTIFDIISYNKGSSVIHMLEQHLGADDFRDGLRHYLKKHQYGNTDTVDLWNALEEISGKPVKDFMEAWTSQPGFPLLQSTHKDGRTTISQQRFYAKPQTTSSAVWPVALKGVGPLSDALLATPTKSWPTVLPGKLNIGQSGYYRCLYNTEELKTLAKEIDDSKLSAIDRLGVLADSFEAAKAGYGSTREALQLLEAFHQEDNNAVWDVMAGGLGSIRGVMDDEKLRELMNPFIRKLISKQLARLGWQPKPNESHFDQLLRPSILGLASAADEPSVVKECLRQFKAMTKTDDLQPDIRGIIYGTAARHGDLKTFEKILKLYNSTDSSEERVTLAAALTGFKQPAIIKKCLALIDTNAVRLQDAAYWIAYSFGNRHAKAAAWEWLKTHWDWLEQNLGSDLAFPRLPMYAAKSFTDKKFLDEYKIFFEPRLTPVLDRAYKQGLESIEWQVAWKERDLKEIMAFFTK